MIDDKQFERIGRSLPWLTRADSELVREFRQKALLSSIPSGKDVFIEGDSVQAIPLLLSGLVRVYQIGETGREVTLYRFRPGESCVLTANAILRRQSFPAIATVEEHAEAVMIPADAFRDWVRRYEPWRDFYFDLVSQRLASVMAIVEEVAFRRLDARVAAFLADRAERENPVRVTHQEIASELGSSREVISRILTDFSSRRVIRTERGAVEVLDFDQIRALAEG